jgi:tripartite-type tricarboxylate transporter receptor subunit TctC
MTSSFPSYSLTTLGPKKPRQVTRGSTPEEFTNFLEQESKKWTDVMKQANIKVIQ